MKASGHCAIFRARSCSPRLLAGMFFVFAAYVIVLGFNRYNISVATSSAPLDDLAHALNLPGLGTLVALGRPSASSPASSPRLLAASRIAFALARQGDLPRLARPSSISARGRSSASASAAFLVMVLTLALASFAKPLDIYDWLGTFGTFGCVIAYALVCAQPRSICIVAAICACIMSSFRWSHWRLLGFVLFGSIYPVPAPPMNVLPWLFAGLLAAGTLYSLLQRSDSCITATGACAGALDQITRDLHIPTLGWTFFSPS